MKLKNILNEGKFKVGDTVKPNMGPHKGLNHVVIWDFGNGTYNIQPTGLRTNQIQYRMGAAGAKEDQLKMVAKANPKPAPNVIDTSDMKPGQNPFGENINEAPMDDRFAKEYEKSGNAVRNHIKHEMGKVNVYTANQKREFLRLDRIIKLAMEVPNNIAKIVNEPGKVRIESKTMKLKDILNEAPTIQKSKVDYSTMDLKSNINLKWRSYDDMFHDLEQWIQVSTDGMGPAQIRVMARELKELSMKYMGYKPDDFDNPDFSNF